MTDRDKLQSPLRVAPGTRAGVTEAMIHDLVHRFYGEIRTDPALGPIFRRVLGEDWGSHLAKMCDFWSSVLLMTGRYAGNPMTAHLQVGGIRPTHFARWLHVFRQTAQQVCPPAAAELFVMRSEMIARALQRGLAVLTADGPPAGAAEWDSVPNRREHFRPKPHQS